MSTVIETQKLTKHFGEVKAVEAVDLSVRKGEIYGFLGLNGAGKTTTIRMLLGMISPTSGQAFLKGKEVRRSDLSLWNNVGSLVEIPYAYPELTVWENLNMFRKLRFIDDPGSVNRVMDQLKLTPYKNRQARHLSLGNNQRLGLAKAMLHQPSILILDEPANGLDPAGIVETRNLLMDLAENQGITIFISSHILSEIARFAGRIGIIHQASMIQEIGTEELDKLLNRLLYIDVEDQAKGLKLLEEQGLKPSVNHEGLIRIADKDAISHPDRVNERLVKKGVVPRQLKVEEEDLESYFLRVITNKGDNQ